MRELKIHLADAEAQEAFGERLAAVLPPKAVVYLVGDLGAGKTTLARGLLRGLGYSGPVRSPTYTLVEPYDFDGRRCAHLDLYRLGDPEELEYLGLRDLVAEETLLLVEWPERGEGLLPLPDLYLRIEYVGAGRDILVEASSELGAEILRRMTDSISG